MTQYDKAYQICEDVVQHDHPQLLDYLYHEYDEELVDMAYQLAIDNGVRKDINKRSIPFETHVTPNKHTDTIARMIADDFKDEPLDDAFVTDYVFKKSLIDIDLSLKSDNLTTSYLDLEHQRHVSRVVGREMESANAYFLNHFDLLIERVMADCVNNDLPRSYAYETASYEAYFTESSTLMAQRVIAYIDHHYDNPNVDMPSDKHIRQILFRFILKRHAIHFDLSDMVKADTYDKSLQAKQLSRHYYVTPSEFGLTETDVINAVNDRYSDELKHIKTMLVREELPHIDPTDVIHDDSRFDITVTFPNDYSMIDVIAREIIVAELITDEKTAYHMLIHYGLLKMRVIDECMALNNARNDLISVDVTLLTTEDDMLDKQSDEDDIYHNNNEQ